MFDSQCNAVQFVTVDIEHAERRLDNFLIYLLKGAPKSLIYRIIRKGEVRVNKKRAKPLDKLKSGDVVRIPPVRLSSEQKAPIKPSDLLVERLTRAILFEDEFLMIVNKPSGLPVHGGSGLSGGLIEILRVIRPDIRFLELAHRLDKETSGCLILAKKRSALKEIHALMREGKVTKIYQTLTRGKWQKQKNRVDLPLRKNELSSGERIVKVDHADGKSAQTIFTVIKQYEIATFCEAKLLTGRTHQIRVHAASTGHPIAGDPKYGDKAFNKLTKQKGLKRLFLHAKLLDFVLPSTKKHYHFEAPMDEMLAAVLNKM